MRANALTVIHKFIRREMFDFSQQLFRAGPEDCEAMVKALTSLAQMLEQHAAHEDERFQPLLRELDPTSAARLTQDHHALDQQLHGLVAYARQLDPTASDCREALILLHLDWNRFLSAYLAHLDDEERTLFLALQDRIPPLTTLADFAKERGAQGKEFLLKIWAVTTCEERLAIEQAASV